MRHRRLAPRRHEFRYRLFMMYFDLDELDRVFERRWLWSTRRWAPARLRREDYLPGREGSLADAARDLVEAAGGARPKGPVRLLTHPRYLGYGFNPVSFYYLWDAAGDELAAVIAEVHNTPWNEVHHYVLSRELTPADAADGADRNAERYHHAKRFHVSPFMAMEQSYDWRFTPPGESLLVHMENVRDGESERFFDATLRLERREISGPALARVLLRYPWMTAKVSAAIYFEAARLWLKRTPFHPHPARRAGRAAEASEKEIGR